MKEGRALPEGEPTFLFTDIEGSTQLIQELGPQYAATLEDHHRIMRDAIAATGGVEVNTEGDAFFVAFDDPAAAVACALTAQLALGAHAWRSQREIRVRMGLHTGPVEVVADDYVGLSVHVAARIASAAHGGQVLVSRALHDRVVGAVADDGSFVALGAHRLKDLQEPAELFQLAHPSLRLDFPALRTLSVLPNNLPTQLTSFVGRDADLAETVELVVANRVVTLTGSGGVGKTRLALQAAAELGADFGDGIWFVELAPLSEGAQIAPAIVAAAGIQNPAERPDEELLVDHLRSRHSLVVIDNCEHLVEAAAELVEAIARACPKVHLLATSRELLGVRGEAVRRVPSLAEVESMQLFVDRATLADAAFRATDDDMHAIAEICARLDGIPMAIELAAARVTSLSCQQIAARLDDRFRLLSGGLRTAMPRQQTLEALVDWSHDLLDERERAVLRRLAVFSGGFSLEAAELVCSDNADVAEADVGNLLDALVQKSLVAAQKTGRTMRFHLLETMRHFARHKLVAAGESDATHDRHARYVLDLVEHELVRDPSFAGVIVELDSVRAAFAWAVDAPHPELALRLTASLADFWLAASLGGEGLAWSLRAVGAGHDEAEHLRARALLAVGRLMLSRKGDAEARPYLDEAVALFRRCDDPADLAEALQFLGRAEASEYVGEVSAGIAHLDEAMALRRSLGDDLGAARVSSTMALVYDGLGEYTRPRGLMLEAFEVARRHGDAQLFEVLALRLSSYAIDAAELGDAHALLEEAIAVGGGRTPIARARIAALLALQGEPDAARRQWDVAVAAIEGVDDWFARGYLQYNLGLVGHRIDAEQAEGLNRASLAACRQANHGPGIGGSLEALAHHALAEGRTEEARDLFEQALAVEIDLRSTFDVGDLHQAIGSVALQRGDLAAFEQRHRLALDEWMRIDAPGRAASCLDALAFAASERGEHVSAAELLGRADVIRTERGAPRRTLPDGIRTLIGDIPLVMTHDLFRSDAQNAADAESVARAAIGDGDFDAARARGRATSGSLRLPS